VIFKISLCIVGGFCTLALVYMHPLKIKLKPAQLVVATPSLSAVVDIYQGNTLRAVIVPASNKKGWTVARLD
jgi:hypothetical protein